MSAAPSTHPAPVGDQHAGQLADGGGLAGAVDPDDQQHRRVVVVRQRLDRSGPARGAVRRPAPRAAPRGRRPRCAPGRWRAGPQRGDHRLGDHRAQIGDQQRVLDGLPGVLVEIAAAEQAEHAAAQRVLRLGEPAAQPLQAALGRRDGADVGRSRRGARGGRSGVPASSSAGQARRVRQAAASGSRTSAIGRFGASRGMVASSPTAGSPLVSRRSGGGLVGGGAVADADDCVNVMPEEAVYPPDRSIGVAVSVLVDESSLILPRRDRTRPNTTTAATTRTAMTAIAIHRPSDTVPLSQGG